MRSVTDVTIVMSTLTNEGAHANKRKENAESRVPWHILIALLLHTNIEMKARTAKPSDIKFALVDIIKGLVIGVFFHVSAETQTFSCF